MAQITIKDMLNAGVHFGHRTNKWNPAMGPYVYDQRGGVHIIDLEKSYNCALKAVDFMKSLGSQGRRIIFVGTKKQAADTIKEAAKRCGQFYIIKRWLGGTLTNFATIKTRIDRLKKIEQMKEKGVLNCYTKKEQTKILKEYDKLLPFAESLPDMNKLPDALFIVDINNEKIALREANKLGIPVIAVVDTNTNPSTVDYPIPGNDDALKSIKLFSDLMADSYLEGYEEFEKNRLKEEKEAPDASDQKEGPPEKKGPHVVKMKSRMVVAAGTAEDVEIAMEVEASEKQQESDPQENKKGEK